MRLVSSVLSLALAGAAAAGPLFVPRQEAPSSQGPVTIPSPVEHSGNTSSCQGYRAVDVQKQGSGLSATLELIAPCGAYGPDVERLNLRVHYHDRNDLRVHIADANGTAHVVNETLGAWPTAADLDGEGATDSPLNFTLVEEPFSFAVTRGEETLFNTTGKPLIFEEQYVYLGTSLPANASVYGFGAHNDPLQLPISEANYSRTLWNRDAYGVPSRTNLYGSTPFYLEHRIAEDGNSSSAHGVFLLNSNGMDIKFPDAGRNLEYHILGGILDLHFLNGPSPVEVSRQYSSLAGNPASVPYWALGLHQCRYGYRDVIDVAEVIANYSAAGIPLESQWSDIDYMNKRAIFTTNPDLWPVEKMTDIVQHLHSRDQHFIVMVDPAMAALPADEYPSLARSEEQNVLLRNADGSAYNGVVWPGATVFPDWTHPNTTAWWVDEFRRFFTEDTIDISGVWLDMNEAASFLPYFEANRERVAMEQNLPPTPPAVRAQPRPIEGFPEWQVGETPTGGAANASQRRSVAPSWDMLSLRQQDSLADTLNAELDDKWLYPPYRISDRRAAPSAADGEGVGDAAAISKNISDFTLATNLVLHSGEREYAVHNLYGHRMVMASREAMLARRPGKKPLLIVRSTFSGTGRYGSRWLGDNLSTWESYRESIRQLVGASAFEATSVAGADAGGFGGNTTETLLARWAGLAAWSGFYRNHNGDTSRPQEFYRFPLAAEAARAAIDLRYRLLDVLYTAIVRSERDGTPTQQPLYYLHPEDRAVLPIETQWYFAGKILVSPVLEENSTTTTVYLPKATYYDVQTLTPLVGEGRNVTFNDVSYSTVPAHILGGTILPMRAESANTTTAVRTKPFSLVVAPRSASNSSAAGELILDDGESLEPEQQTDVTFRLDANTLSANGTWGFEATLASIVFAGQTASRSLRIDGGEARQPSAFNETSQTLRFDGLNMTMAANWTAVLA